MTQDNTYQEFISVLKTAQLPYRLQHFQGHSNTVNPSSGYFPYHLTLAQSNNLND